MLLTRRSSFVLVACALASLASADESGIPLGDNAACHAGPLAQFGRYIGDWKIEDWRLARDGSGWSPGPGARWIFTCLGNGTAIQDFWLTPDGNIGSNLRTYNGDSGTWDIAWAINTAPGFAHITARQSDDGSMVMQYLRPEPTPLRRITFFPPDTAGWRWQLEFSTDGGDNWTEVYRIKATRFDSAASD